MSSLQIIFFLLFFIASGVTNLLWFRAKSLLRKRGLQSSLFFNQYQDLKLLAEVAANSDDPDAQSFGALRKRIFQSLYFTFACFAGFFIASVFHVFGKNIQ